MSEQMQIVLILDDDDAVRESLADFFEDQSRPSSFPSTQKHNHCMEKPDDVTLVVNSLKSRKDWGMQF
ncbi:hypothetical protein QUF80_00755 [Desulfococcaceae bacterium HSG8]|nr:hypothetical protein [Desulfococcaceae bacterium HSG8]